MMCFTPFMTIQIQHICALRLCKLYTIPVFRDKIICPFHIFCQHSFQLIRPFLTILTVGTDQSVHGKNIHIVIMRQRCLLVHPISKILVVYNMIGTDQSGKIERLGRRIHCNRSVFCILGNRLCRNMLTIAQCQV